MPKRLAVVIELDPAYPETDLEARVKRRRQERRMLRSLIGLPEDHAF